MNSRRPVNPPSLAAGLSGLHCAVTTTIEVAHHIRNNRVIIPEPAWWDLQSPFLYGGAVELWREGRKLESLRVQIGLRHTTGKGSRIVHNGRPVELKSRRVESADETTLLHREKRRIQHRRSAGHDRRRSLRSRGSHRDVRDYGWPNGDRSAAASERDQTVRICSSASASRSMSSAELNAPGLAREVPSGNVPNARWM